MDAFGKQQGAGRQTSMSDLGGNLEEKVVLDVARLLAVGSHGSLLWGSSEATVPERCKAKSGVGELDSLPLARGTKICTRQNAKTELSRSCERAERIGLKGLAVARSLR
jgi:hypothetical protein